MNLLLNKKAIIIGKGIAGPAIAIQLQKLGIEPTIYEARSANDDNQGIFLGLTPNGLNVLSEFVNLENLKKEYTPGKMCFFNHRNRNIGELDTKHQMKKYGAETIQIKRSALSRELRNAASIKRIDIKFKKKLVDIQQNEKSVTAIFADGSTAIADMLIACDGTHSATRKIIFPEAPKPKYTQLLSTGGYATFPGYDHLFGSIRMIFGKTAFFAYAVSNKGDIWWFNNFYREKEPTREEIRTGLQNEIKAHLLEIHKNDPAPIFDIIAATKDIFVYPIYDIPSLKEWHKEHACLIGDAAHTTAPHIGQGASIALEDTIVLAKCIRDLPSLKSAFCKFQEMRQPRVEKLIKTARKIGNQKSKPNPITVFFRDLLLPHFIKFEKQKMNWIYGYRIDWSSPIRS